MINYKSIEKLHQSEQGSVVLKVKNLNTGEICALKLIGHLNDKLNRLIFKREVAALKKLNQFDDIVKIYDSSDKLRLNEQPGYGAILLELLDGQPFNLMDFSIFSDLEKITICRNSAKAILHAHQCGILHRDVKPSNIIIMDNSTKVKVIDFGSSKLKAIVDEESAHRIFSTGYVAPEVAQGQEATEKSDIYSLGAVFHYVFLSCPPNISQTKSNVTSAAIIPEMQNLLLDMLMISPDDRIDDMQEVVTILEAIIGKLNTNAFNYNFHLDTAKLDGLKRQFSVEKAMTYQHFLSVHLPKEFNSMYGIYRQGNIYEFIGDNLFMECLYDEKRRCFVASKLYEIPLDKRSKLQRIFGPVEGKKHFIGFNKSVSVQNHSNQLKIQLHNYANERNSVGERNRLFDELFGKWRESIQESFESIKEKNIQIGYSDFWFDQNKLYLVLENIKGIEIDNLTQDTHFVFDTLENNRIKLLPIGYFEDYYQEDEKSVLILSLDKNAAKSKLTSLLNAKKVILEDYIKQTIALKRQLHAITALKNDDYNTTGLKDIILKLSVPTSTQLISSLKFQNARLNNFQQQAIQKAIYSNNVSLIQGPPGTGKTSVIAELIQQILVNAMVSDAHPKILIVSQSHTAVDNILEKLSPWSASKNLRIVRIGKKEDVSDDVASNYLIDAIKENIYMNIQTSSTSFITRITEQLSPQNEDDQRIRESKEASLQKWEEAREIHEDWLKRCGDYSLLRYQIVNTATIIAGTCIGFLGDENIRDMAFDYVIVDEAAKATTPELLVSIIKAEKIVLVGDQNQLAPFADQSLSKLAAMLVKNPKYRIFDILYDSLPDTHKQFLATQYRMHSAIGNLISTIFYEGKIITGIKDEDRQHGVHKFEGKAIVWLDTSKMVDHNSKRGSGGSYHNLTEGHIIRKLLGEMNSQENASSLDIGIITAYRDQKDHVTKLYKKGNFKSIGNVDINTLDAFQGRENDIIIYSTVRTDGNIVFLQEKERVNVAFSRAKKLLVICGDMKFIESWSGPTNTFVEIVQYLRDNPDTCQVINAQEVLQP